MATYTITDTITESGKSTVYRAVDDTGRTIAVKHLRGNHEVYRQLQEARHPFLPEIYSVTATEDETIVEEEWIDGPSIGQAGSNERHIRWAILELCQVLAFLHKQGILHRDVKPSNILLAPDGHIRLIDFDASRTMKEDQSGDTQLLGTQGYAPPEQYGFAQTDQRADIYAVGVTFRTLLGPLSRKRRNRNIIRKCTSLDPKHRYRNVDALRGKIYRGMLWRWVFRPLLLFFFAAVIALSALVISSLLRYPEAVAELQDVTQATGEELSAFIVRDRVFADVDMDFPPRPFSFGTPTYDMETGSYWGLLSPVPRSWRNDGVGAAYDALMEHDPNYFYIYIDRVNGKYVFGKLSGEYNARSGTNIYRKFEGLVRVDAAGNVQTLTPEHCAQCPDEMAKLYWMHTFDMPLF